jgi:mannose-6-phosphate isomerase-like protein (cupin superfamily)
MPIDQQVSDQQRRPSETPAAEDFPKGAFHVSHEREADWDEGLRAYFAYRDLGMAKASGGRVQAHVIKPVGGGSKGPGDLHYHTLDFQMVYVLKGRAKVWFEDIGEVTLEAGSCMYQKPDIHHRVLEYSDDYTVIEITLPAEFPTVTVAP